MIIHMDTTADTSTDILHKEEVISSFYICRMCECIYVEASSTDCTSCNNLSCVILYQGDTLDEALSQKRAQYGAGVEEEECIELKHLK